MDDLARTIAGTVFATVVAYRRSHQVRPVLLILARTDVYEALEATVSDQVAGWHVRGRSLLVLGYPVVWDALGELTAAEPGWRVEFAD